MSNSSPESEAGRLSRLFAIDAEARLSHQGDANRQYRERRVRMLERQQMARNQLDQDRTREWSDASSQVMKSFEPRRMELKRLHGQEQRFAVAPTTRAAERAMFIARNYSRFSRHARPSAREITRMVASPSHFVRSLAILHWREQDQLFRDEALAVNCATAPIWNHYDRKAMSLDERQNADLDAALGLFFKNSPDQREAVNHYKEEFAPARNVTIAPQVARDERSPVQSPDAAGSRSLSDRVAKIRVDMANWRAANQDKDLDKGRER